SNAARARASRIWLAAIEKRIVTAEEKARAKAVFCNCSVCQNESFMEILLLRHGIAEDPAPGMHDGDRALTPKGERKLKDVLVRAREAGARPSVILSSPLL